MSNVRLAKNLNNSNCCENFVKLSFLNNSIPFFLFLFLCLHPRLPSGLVPGEFLSLFFNLFFMNHRALVSRDLLSWSNLLTFFSCRIDERSVESTRISSIKVSLLNFGLIYCTKLFLIFLPNDLFSGGSLESAGRCPWEFISSPSSRLFPL